MAIGAGAAGGWVARTLANTLEKRAAQKLATTEAEKLASTEAQKLALQDMSNTPEEWRFATGTGDAATTATEPTQPASKIAGTINRATALPGQLVSSGREAFSALPIKGKAAILGGGALFVGAPIKRAYSNYMNYGVLPGPIQAQVNRYGLDTPLTPADSAAFSQQTNPANIINRQYDIQSQSANDLYGPSSMNALANQTAGSNIADLFNQIALQNSGVTGQNPDIYGAAKATGAQIAAAQAAPTGSQTSGMVPVSGAAATLPGQVAAEGSNLGQYLANQTAINSNDINFWNNLAALQGQGYQQQLAGETFRQGRQAQADIATARAKALAQAAGTLNPIATQAGFNAAQDEWRRLGPLGQQAYAAQGITNPAQYYAYQTLQKQQQGK